MEKCGWCEVASRITPFGKIGIGTRVELSFGDLKTSYKPIIAVPISSRAASDVFRKAQDLD
jgi:hypothetical protein